MNEPNECRANVWMYVRRRILTRGKKKEKKIRAQDEGNSITVINKKLIQ